MVQGKISRREMLCGTLVMMGVSVGCTTASPEFLTAAPENFFYRDSQPAYPQFLKFSEYPGFVFDFSDWDSILDAIVIDFGPSERVAARKGNSQAGTRLRFGHQTRHRLEGNRIAFSLINEKNKELLTLHRDNLEDIGNQVPLENFSKNSQIAFWMNLHNSIVIDEIGQNYPVRNPSALTYGPDKILLDRAKLVTIDGVPLSLYEIRIEIVYRLLQSPLALYGFFMGDVSSPEINQLAFTESNLLSTLRGNATRYVNSLRAITDWGRHMTISKLYDRNRFLFPDWPNGVINHFRDVGSEDIKAILDRDLPIQFQRYDDKVADLAGGQNHNSSGPVSNESGASLGVSGLPEDALRLLGERSRKLERLRFKELRALRIKRRETEVTVEDEVTNR